MARLKEEKIFREFIKHGWPIFDNDSALADAKTTGKGEDGQPNNTMSTEDFIDLMIGLLAHNYYPTDVLMHPLVWSMFAKNQYLDVLSTAAFGGDGGTISLNPNAVQGRIPFAINVNLSPFMPFDRANKKFDMAVVDSNEVGVLLVKDDLSVEQFDEPLRDIQTIKLKERYGCAVLNEGRAIALAKNIAFAKSYPDPMRVKQLQ